MAQTTPALQPSLFDQPAVTAQAQRPRAQSLQQQGQLLRGIELLSTVTGLTTEQAQEVLLRAGGSLQELARLPEHALRALPHIGPKRATQIAALTKWALLLQERDSKASVQLQNPTDLANLLMLEMGLLRQEELRVIGLNTKNAILGMETVYRGSLNTAVVRIAEIMEMPINLKCMGMILVHNHPSGDPTPSPEDVHVTKLIKEAATLLDIELLDHIVIGRNQFVSLKERGLAFG